MGFDEAWIRQPLFQRAQDRIETLDVADLEDEAAFGGKRGQLTRMRCILRDRFFDEEMFPAREKIPPDFEMRVRWRRDRSGVHLFCELF